MIKDRLLVNEVFAGPHYWCIEMMLKEQPQPARSKYPDQLKSPQHTPLDIFQDFAALLKPGFIFFIWALHQMKKRLIK